MEEFLLQTYTLILPVLMGYIVWLLKRQKRDRDANSKGTKMKQGWNWKLKSLSGIRKELNNVC